MIKLNRQIFNDNDEDANEMIDINFEDWMIIDEKLIKVFETNLKNGKFKYVLILYKMLKYIFI